MKYRCKAKKQHVYKQRPLYLLSYLLWRSSSIRIITNKTRILGAVEELSISWVAKPVCLGWRKAKFRAYFRTIWKEIRVRQASNSLHWLDSPENIPKHHKSPELVLLIFWRVFDFAENNTSSRYYNFDNNQKEQEQRLVIQIVE